MILVDLMDEIFDVLRDDAGLELNVPGAIAGDGPGNIAATPAPFVELPEIVYGAGGHGLDRIEDFGLTIVFGPANNHTVFKRALEAASTTGAKSVWAALTNHQWVSCDTLYVLRAEPLIDTVRGAPAVVYTFHLDITGAR